MSIQNLLRFPAALSSARRAAALTQKELALDARLDQSSLCALEKGRRHCPSRDVVTRIATSLKLAPDASDQLQWAAAHDRVLLAVALEAADAVGIVSLSLEAAQALDVVEREGVEALLRDVLSSKSVLAQVVAKRGSRTREAAMD